MIFTVAIISPGTTGDVPAFIAQDFVPDPAHNILAPAGTLGGVGFRTGALPIVLIATDTGSGGKGCPTSSARRAAGLQWPSEASVGSARSAKPLVVMPASQMPPILILQRSPRMPSVPGHRVGLATHSFAHLHSPRGRHHQAPGECDNCHNPHGIRSDGKLMPFMTYKNQENLCYRCHADSPAIRASS